MTTLNYGPKFNAKTMRLSVVPSRVADGGYCATVWTRARVVHGGPGMLGHGKAPTAKEARKLAIADLKVRGGAVS